MSMQLLLPHLSVKVMLNVENHNPTDAEVEIAKSVYAMGATQPQPEEAYQLGHDVWVVSRKFIGGLEFFHRVGVQCPCTKPKGDILDSLQTMTDYLEEWHQEWAKIEYALSENPMNYHQADSPRCTYCAAIKQARALLEGIPK